MTAISLLTDRNNLSVILMKMRHKFIAFDHSIFACSWTLFNRCFNVRVLVMHSFWDITPRKKKQRKTHFFQENKFFNQFSTSSFCACKQLGAPDWQILEKLKLLKNKIVTIFSKMAFSKNWLGHVRLVCVRSRVRSSRPATFFRGV